MDDRNFIRKYVKADSKQKVDIIFRHYSDFMGIIDGYTEGLRYMIECEKDYNHRAAKGDLGVRVQSGGSISDPTAAAAIRKVMTIEALINCDFSGDVLENVDHAEEYMKDAYVLRSMRSDYALFTGQLAILGDKRDFFEKYLRGEINLMEYATQSGIAYETAKQKTYNIRNRIRTQVVGFMDKKMGGIG
mgnify:FL=1|jgi:hypothetical protein